MYTLLYQELKGYLTAIRSAVTLCELLVTAHRHSVARGEGAPNDGGHSTQLFLLGAEQPNSTDIELSCSKRVNAMLQSYT